MRTGLRPDREVTVLLALLLACGFAPSPADTGAGSDCPNDEKLSEIYDLFLDAYLWYEQVPVLDPTSYASPGDLIDALVYEAYDRWSYAISADAHTTWYEEGRYVGLGFELKYDEAGAVRFALVYPGSPADLGGLARGWTLLGVNGQTAEAITAADAWATVWGDVEPGTVVLLDVEDQAGATATLELAMDWITVTTVMAPQVVEQDGHVVGYLYLDAFLGTSIDGLEGAFADFATAGVTDVVVDLRYDGGGRLDTAAYLASLLAGPALEGDLFLSYRHNALHPDWDSFQRFEEPAVALDLGRIVFIVTGETASASEALVNGLLPWAEVAVVGATTYGKPVGMYGWEICDLVVAPIAFRMANAEGTTDYFDGLGVDCEADDSLDEPLGSPQDDALGTALALIAGGSCEPPVARPVAPRPRSPFVRDLGAW